MKSYITASLQLCRLAPRLKGIVMADAVTRTGDARSI